MISASSEARDPESTTVSAPAAAPAIARRSRRSMAMLVSTAQSIMPTMPWSVALPSTEPVRASRLSPSMLQPRLELTEKKASSSDETDRTRSSSSTDARDREPFVPRPTADQRGHRCRREQAGDREPGKAGQGEVLDDLGQLAGASRQRPERDSQRDDEELAEDEAVERSGDPDQGRQPDQP